MANEVSLIEKTKILLGSVLFTYTYSCGDPLEPSDEPTTEEPVLAEQKPIETTTLPKAEENNADSTKTYTVGGNVIGLKGSATLSLNSSEDLTLQTNGVYVFQTLLSKGASFVITVKLQPANQVCSVSEGTGTIGLENQASSHLTCLDATQVAFNTHIQPAITKSCGSCHAGTKIAGGNLGSDVASNRNVIINYIQNNSANTFREKIQGKPSHGGGNQTTNLPLEKVDAWFTAEGFSLTSP